MKQHTTLATISTVVRKLGLDPMRFIRTDATDDELLNAREESDMAERLNGIEDAYERSQPRDMTAEEMAAQYRAGYVTTVHVLGEVAPEVPTSHGVSLREASVAARQAGGMDPTNPPGIEGNMWATTGKNSAGSPPSMGPAAETSTYTCPHCGQVFTVHNVAHEAASMDASALTSTLDGLLDSMCNLYGALAGKRVISADDKREAVAAVAKMLGEHIDHLADVQDKYTGGADDAEIRQSATETAYLESRGYVGMARPLPEYAGQD